MIRLLLTFCFLLAGGAPLLAQVTYDEKWSYDQEKQGYAKNCKLPAGGEQQLVYFKEKPNWVYWYNPDANVYWSACPTVSHPKWGESIQKGSDLFLLATTKAKKLEDAVFPDVANGTNFKPATAKDKDGTLVQLTGVPTGLP